MLTEFLIPFSRKLSCKFVTNKVVVKNVATTYRPQRFKRVATLRRKIYGSLHSLAVANYRFLGHAIDTSMMTSCVYIQPMYAVYRSGIHRQTYAVKLCLPGGQTGTPRTTQQLYCTPCTTLTFYDTRHGN